MKAASINQPDQMQIVELEIPRPEGNEVLIRVMASGICGTDIHIFRGEYLGDYPVIPGHEFSGLVEEVGGDVQRFKPGDRVSVEPNIACDNCVNCLNNRQNFCLNWQAVGVTRQGGMAQWVTAPEKAVFDIGDLPFEAGAFMEPLSCVLHGLARLSPDLASRVVILGAGPIGVLLLQGIRQQGAHHVTVVDKNPFRAQLAAKFGADRSLTSLDELELDAFDAVIDATGAIPVMSRSLDFARPGGKVLLFGVPPSGELMSIEAFKIFHKGLTVLSSYTSVRNSYQALDLLKSGRVEVNGLVSHRLPLEEFEDGIQMLERGVSEIRKVMIFPNGSTM